MDTRKVKSASARPLAFRAQRLVDAQRVCREWARTMRAADALAAKPRLYRESPPKRAGLSMADLVARMPGLKNSPVVRAAMAAYYDAKA